MDQPVVRKQIGLLFFSTYKVWAGGIIYMLNLIRALDLLDDREKPELIIFHGFDAPVEDIKALEYPYISYCQISSSNLFVKAYLKLKRILTGKSAFYSRLPETVYPYNQYIFLGKKQIHWIPDFQEWYLPHMFQEEEIVKRKEYQATIAGSGGKVVFSSNDAMNDFQKFFPNHNCTLRLLHFASLLPEFKHLQISEIRKKFDIQGVYFMSPNQFWAHKNHMIILEAINLLKIDNLDFTIVFTGSQNDYRNKDYFEKLDNYIQENELQRWVKFLGFIDRGEQLSLMHNSRAIIQPSLFEGWSTVVEDTKAMNQFIILSDIPVHREQLSENCSFFDPSSATELAAIIKRNVEAEPLKVVTDYSKNIRHFSENILNALLN
ncbi:glycosyltransferase [Dyadobacter sp. CY323]|uniref:glycosyltransferase n=1 Tax=Dyadobacter sp. CY323 TaxID=2907302 RepID=UPI001F1BBAC0|nr:glycosyltransferase [Dyadobacter sp. CY323]MCE6990960.1 glycosyltransferase [Dyadobacter sp. CY323]